MGLDDMTSVELYNHNISRGWTPTGVWTKEFSEVNDELKRAVKKFPSNFGNAHEGYAVLLEEVDEAWDAIKKNDIIHARKEMVQVAAMAIRFLLEVKP